MVFDGVGAAIDAMGGSFLMSYATVAVIAAHQRHLTRKSHLIPAYGWLPPRASPPNPGRTAWHNWQFELSPPSKCVANGWSHSPLSNTPRYRLSGTSRNR
jgi:hypothetical protein